MRAAWRNLVREWRRFREALHGERVFRRHQKGRCTWMEEPSHGTFRWRKCEYVFCNKREYMPDTAARWIPDASLVQASQLRPRWDAAAARLQGAIGGVGVSSIEQRSRQINEFYQRRYVNHADGHQIIGWTQGDTVLEEDDEAA